jgi:hypothetical protein
MHFRRNSQTNLALDNELVSWQWTVVPPQADRSRGPRGRETYTEHSGVKGDVRTGFEEKVAKVTKGRGRGYAEQWHTRESMIRKKASARRWRALADRPARKETADLDTPATVMKTAKLNERSQFWLFTSDKRKGLSEVNFRRNSKTILALDNVAGNSER